MEMENLSLNFLINNGVAVAVMWYVLTRLNSTLKDLTGVIDKLNKESSKRLDALENNQRLFQMQLHELQMHVDAMRRGD